MEIENNITFKTFKLVSLPGVQDSSLTTVVGDNINIMKTTFELNFYFYQALKQQGYIKIWKQREAVNLKSFTLITCKPVSYTHLTLPTIYSV